MLGILALDTAFPRIPGDVGGAGTFGFAVRIATVRGATVDVTVHGPRDSLLPEFISAGQALAAQGCDGIVTTCGFLVRWQRQLAEALPVPVMTSALLQVPTVARVLPRGRVVGIVTYSVGDLTPDVLDGAGVDRATPVAGVDPAGAFAHTIREGAATLDTALMSADTVAAARALVGANRDVGAIVLECANMPPYAAAVRCAVGLPVFDAAQAFAWFHAGLAGYDRADLW
ncbi:MAG: aspartate/glutamate racemase family protein [Betaproteobacteria bacterium]